MTSRRGLGRGLGALIPTSPAPSRAVAEAEPAAVGAHFAEIAVRDIRANPRQPRREFEAGPLAELVASITEVGLLQPIVVRALPTEQQTVGYELVVGERRWRAAVQAGLDAIPAIVRDTPDDAMLRDALLENLHRAQLNPLEEAAAYQQLLDDFGCTHDELASRIGRSRPQVTNTVRLLRLTPSVQRRVAAGVLSAGHARALVALSDPAQQERLAHRVAAEGLSVRTLEEVIAVGGGDDPAPRPAANGSAAARGRGRMVAPGLHDLAGRLSERFDTRVRVDLGTRKGRITVEFASLDDLERIVAVMDPGGDQTTRRHVAEATSRSGDEPISP